MFINHSIVVMGVAGCGKSSLASILSKTHGLVLIEGDDYHTLASVEKMRSGQSLTDQDREVWLQILCEKLKEHAGHVILSCSALKLAYREVLRSAVPQLRFIYLALTVEAAQKRVADRPADHYFPACLVENQFQTLEAPSGENLVLQLNAMDRLATLQDQVSDWLQLMTDVTADPAHLGV